MTVTAANRLFPNWKISKSYDESGRWKRYVATHNKYEYDSERMLSNGLGSEEENLVQLCKWIEYMETRYSSLSGEAIEPKYDEHFQTETIESRYSSEPDVFVEVFRDDLFVYGLHTDSLVVFFFMLDEPSQTMRDIIQNNIDVIPAALDPFSEEFIVNDPDVISSSIEVLERGKGRFEPESEGATLLDVAILRLRMRS